MNKIYQNAYLVCKNAGFTLIELLVVVLIIGILAAVALPQYEKAVTKARFTQMLTAGKSLKEGCETFYMANGDYPLYWSDLDIEYPGCTEGTSRYLLHCKNFVVDLFAGEQANLRFFDTHLLKNIEGMNTVDLLQQTPVMYTVWLDHSENPGKTECQSSIAGFCESMGF